MKIQYFIRIIYKMKILFSFIFLSTLIISSCSSSVKNDKISNTNPEITLQKIAAFKSAEQIYGDEWKLIFRKLDDSLYIVLYTDINKINKLKDNLVILTDNKHTTNPDFVNLHYNIKYIEETALDPITEENVIINRLINITRSQSDRFIEAGFEDDTIADDFIIDLKNNVKNDAVQEISEMISYPLNVVIKKKKMKINDSESFIKDYNIIFSKRVKNSIISQSIADVKGSSKGIIIGNGEILISHVEGKIFIISITSY